MPTLVLISRDGARRFVVDGKELVIGRDSHLPVVLKGNKVSRRHARVIREGGQYFVEDLGSSNGTFLNGMRLTGLTPLQTNDEIRIGSHALRLEDENSEGPPLAIQRRTLASSENQEIFQDNPARQLQAILRIAHELANSLDLETLLNRFADGVLLLFPKADRVVVLLLENDETIPRVVRDRRTTEKNQGRPFSRAILKQVVAEGIGVLAREVEALKENQSLRGMGVKSLLCVPLRSAGSPVFGAVQTDRFQSGGSFNVEDLHLLTAISLQISLVIDSARLHQRLLRQDRIARELSLAREIQQAFLPSAAPDLPVGPVDLYATLDPAEEVAGDFYDFIVLDRSRIAIIVADVSDKGIPAALFMSLVRAQFRQLAVPGRTPAEILIGINDAIAIENPKLMFVTALVVIFDVTSGQCTFARAAHPPPILRTNDSAAQYIESPQGCLLGIVQFCPQIHDQALQLRAGETLLLYTDGLIEAAARSGESFGPDRLLECARQIPLECSLKDWANRLTDQARTFCGGLLPQDDVTLVLLRHKPVGNSR